MVTATALVLALGAAGTANAATAFHTGNAMLKACQGSDPQLCLGYISGIADALSGGVTTLSGWRACIPISVEIGEVRDISVKFLTAHPEWQHFSASSQVAHALEDAFPCK